MVTMDLVKRQQPVRPKRSGAAVQDATAIAAGLASCKELIIPNLIDSAAIAFAHAVSKAGVQCDLEPIMESEIERDLFDYRGKR